MDYKRIVLSALVFMVVAQVVHIISSILTMGYYTDPSYFPLWSSIMMPKAGPPGMEFFVVSVVFNLLIGAVFAVTYLLLNKSISGKNVMKGVNFAIMLFMLATVPGTLMMFLILSVPYALLFAWAIENLIIYLIFGVALTKII